MSTVRRLIEIIDRAYSQRSWHGTNLRGSIRGLTALDASWRPGPKRHNVWEIVVHCAYWKYAVRRRLTGERRGSFPLKGSNWFERRAANDLLGWKRDVALLDGTHRQLRDAIGRLTERDLARRARGSVV